MDDVNPRVSKLFFSAELLGAALNLADSARTRGPLRTATLFALSTGLPTFGNSWLRDRSDSCATARSHG